MVYHALIKVLPLNKKVILFESSVGRSYSGNPKYIYEEFVTQGLDRQFKCIWVLENASISIPGCCIKVKKMRFKHLYYASISGLWIVDSRQSELFTKRKERKIVQTWHGTPLKKLALDMHVMNIAGDTNLTDYQMKFVEDVKSWDYLISQNHYSTEKFRSAFSFQGDFWEVGYPRNDILMNHNDEATIYQLKIKLGLPVNKKIILYAPTFRDDEYYGPGKWKLNLHLDLSLMKKQLAEDFIIVIKLHYFQQEQIRFNYELNDFIYVFHPDQDIQLLYLVADLMITDYSSVMFDYSILRKPIILYLYDFEKYRNELRGFYFDIRKESPGPVVYDQEQLIEAINSSEANFELYKEKYEKFIEQFNYLDDGKAASRVVDKIKQIYMINQ
ncbi:CDP-glycerol glycerophosphotransferase family protein [Paenibacillus sp. M1]|uniref:CDP-glycerol glycerophosphotransferase family protein n=1 Tax=Paenibacillus haidiansis TaxID=1574488 RepID=A0ABU7VXY9_9BACL